MAVSLDVPGVRGDGVAAPEEDEVGPLFHFAEGAGRFADLLQRDDGRGMATAGGRVDGRAEEIGEGHGRTLAFGGAARETVDEGRPRGLQDRGGTGVRHVPIHRNTVEFRPAVDVGSLSEEPRACEIARSFGRDDPTAFGGDPEIVADATADGASDVGPDDATSEFQVICPCRRPLSGSLWLCGASR